MGLKKGRQLTEETLGGSKIGETPRQNTEEEKKMLQKFFAKMSNEEGQGLVEYGLILFLVSIVVVLALTAVGVSVNSVFVAIGAAF